jgi:putative endopeptidase
MLLCCALGAAGAAAAPAPEYRPFGLDLTARDPSVHPGDDFFLHANGRYLARTAIPAERATATRRDAISDTIQARLRLLLSQAARSAPAVPADARGKVGAFYAAFMDEAAVERAGVHAIDPELNAIRDAPDHAALALLMGRSTVDFFPSPFALQIDADLKQPGRYAVYLGQSGLGLPDIDYYLRPDFSAQRAAYHRYIAKLLTLARWPDAEAAAEAVLALETAIAQASWSKVAQRDPVTQYNPVTPAELQALAPDFAWVQYLRGAQLDQATRLIATQNTALPKIAAVVGASPPATLKAWMAFRVADDAAPYLSRAFVAARFALRDQVLTGRTALAPRWKRGIEAVAGGECDGQPHNCFGTLKWAAGDLYAKRHFPQRTKARITALVGDLKTAFRQRLLAIEWMGPATKAEALKKLDSYAIKVGYPDRVRSYDGVAIRRDDLLANVRAAAAGDWAFVVDRSNGAVDRDEWLLTPQANNAYSGSLRDVVFPAGILQAPTFDAAADAAINYGAAGAVIGHELTHGFDDEGRATDAEGALRDWWSDADAAAFNQRAAVLGAQYAQYEPAPGTHINAALTMGENLADLGGLSMALDAYHLSLQGKPAPVLGGLTGDQRVFLGWAQFWAGKSTPEEARRMATADPHSDRKYRVNGVVRNIDAWYAAFGVKPGDALYIAPEQRARVW